MNYREMTLEQLDAIAPKQETRGRKRDPRSKRSRLENMKPGDMEVFTAPAGVTIESLQRAIGSDITKNLRSISTEFSQRKALLVFDEHQAPIVCSVVTRSAAR